MGMLKKIAGKIEDAVSPSRRRVKRRLKMYAGPQPGPRRRRRTRRRRS